MATFTTLPKTDTFKFAFPDTKATKSKPDCTPAPTASAMSVPTIQNASENVTLALVNLLANVVGSAHGSGASLSIPLPMPSESTSNPHAGHPATSPSDLGDFLDYATANFAVTGRSYHATLEAERMGPDVLAILSDTKDLVVDMGIPRGDAHHLKHAADTWVADTSHPNKKHRHAKSLLSEAQGTPRRAIGFTDNPAAPPSGHERTEAECAGRPYPGTKGNFLWEERFPDGGARTFWANMPSPSLTPRDPILAPPGTVFLGVGGGEYIEVLRAPRYEVAMVDDEEDIQAVFGHGM
ncbi:hypothetical protein FRC08_012929 [Ceratobasidium sp. 394]|nr:hypothetical protein FRC08_012929 [Ceratobasidium sp. 394]